MKLAVYNSEKSIREEKRPHGSPVCAHRLEANTQDWKGVLVEYTDNPEVFFTAHHVGHCYTVIRGHCCPLGQSRTDAIQSHCCASGHFCSNVTRCHCSSTVCTNNDPGHAGFRPSQEKRDRQTHRHERAQKVFFTHVRGEEHLKMDVTTIGCGNGIELAQCRVHLRAVLNCAISL